MKSLVSSKTPCSIPILANVKKTVSHGGEHFLSLRPVLLLRYYLTYELEVKSFNQSKVANLF